MTNCCFVIRINSKLSVLTFGANYSGGREKERGRKNGGEKFARLIIVISSGIGSNVPIFRRSSEINREKDRYVISRARRGNKKVNACTYVGI